MTDIDTSSLSPPARKLFAMWASGQDVIALTSVATAYRHRVAILRAGGPDILQPKPAADTTVVHFRRVLRPVPATVPADIAALIYHPRAA